MHCLARVDAALEVLFFAAAQAFARAAFASRFFFAAFALALVALWVLPLFASAVAGTEETSISAPVASRPAKAKRAIEVSESECRFGTLLPSTLSPEARPLAGRADVHTICKRPANWTGVLDTTPGALRASNQWRLGGATTRSLLCQSTPLAMSNDTRPPLVDTKPSPAALRACPKLTSGSARPNAV